MLTDVDKARIADHLVPLCAWRTVLAASSAFSVTVTPGMTSVSSFVLLVAATLLTVTCASCASTALPSPAWP